MAVVSTEPLTRDEIWQIGTPGSLWVFGRGALHATLPSGAPDRIPSFRASRKPKAAAVADPPAPASRRA